MAFHRGMKGQTWNPAAMRLLGQAGRQPTLCVPHWRVPSLAHIDWQQLRAQGIQAVVLDKDNTLAAPYGSTLFSPSLRSALHEAQDTFGSQRVALFSNTLGFVDSTRQWEGVAIVQHPHAQKPEGLIEVLDHFHETTGTPIEPHTVVMIGDRLLTDVVFGNMHGMATIYTEPLVTGPNSGEKWVVRVVRSFSSVC